MARERELKLSAPPGYRIPSLDDLDLKLTPATERRLTTTYYDTPDLRLARWGFTMRYRAGEGWTVKLPSSGSGGVVVRDEIEFPGSPSKPPAGALALLRGLLRRDEPVLVARLRTLRRISSIVDSGEHRLAEVDDDEVSVIDGRRLAARFRQLEVELAADAPDDLLSRLSTLFQAAGAAPDPVSKAARALGPRAVAPPEAHPKAVRPGDPAGAAVAAAIAASTARLLLHDPGVRLGDDPEAVHQARVATRRLRADLRTFRDFVDPDWAAALVEELRWAAGDLGDVRDSEVLTELLEGLARRLPSGDRAAGLRLARRLGQVRDDARRRLIATLDSPRYLELIEALLAASHEPPLTEASAAPAEEALPPQVKAGWRRIRRAVRDLPDDPPDEHLHRVRILAKRLRYAAEAVGTVLNGYGKLAKDAAALQDVLGRHQDAVVAQGWLREQRPKLTPTQAFVAGELWGLAGGQAAQSRLEWPAAWKALRKSAGGL
ncbi:MAG TPA: CHAD domain-containing protein [Candidatus Dormibacteraeota bacterium]